MKLNWSLGYGLALCIGSSGLPAQAAVTFSAVGIQTRSIASVDYFGVLDEVTNDSGLTEYFEFQNRFESFSEAYAQASSQAGGFFTAEGSSSLITEFNGAETLNAFLFGHAGASLNLPLERGFGSGEESWQLYT